MTFPGKTAIRKARMLPLTVGRLCFTFFILFCLLLILRNSEIAIEYIHRGLLLCAKTVIPALFPFMVLSEIIVGGELGEQVLKLLARPLYVILRLPPAGSIAVLLGLICGSPVGAKCAIRAFECGRLSQNEAERVIACSSAPSSAFVISAIGVSLWSNRRFGIALYACVLLSSLITGILLAQRARKFPVTQKTAPYRSAPSPIDAKLFTSAVASSTKSILLVCAYVVFFSAFVGTLGILLGQCHLPQSLTALLFCIFEISGGVSQASAMGGNQLAILFTAFAVGWSGLSVHCQILSLCDSTALSLRPYFKAKLLQAVLCPILFLLCTILFPEITLPAEICARG